METMLFTVRPRLFGSSVNFVPASRVFGRKVSRPDFRAKVLPTVPAIAD